jgi:TatD DNase family protein
MELVDTHCHIHFPDYEMDPKLAIANAKEDKVTRLLCVGCTLADSKLAVGFAHDYEHIWATIGLHPHEGSVYVNNDNALQQFRSLAAKAKVVAIGETGLDYHYNHSSKEDQHKLLRFQLDLAIEHGLPLIFHVREAFEDFWKIIDEYQSLGAKLKGVVHSFSAGQKELEQVLGHGFYVGLNGIMTFTKQQEQLEAAKAVPLSKLLLETDAPFLTPVPYRGMIGEPRYVRVVAEFLANLRGESLPEIAQATTQNALELFNLR